MINGSLPDPEEKKWGDLVGVIQKAKMLIFAYEREEKISLDQLGSLKKGYSATANHFTNDSGMQQTTRLVVHQEREK